MKFPAFTALVLMLTGCASYHQEKAQDQRDAYLAMSKGEIRKLITIKDDPLETVAVLSTEDVFVQKFGLANVTWSDYFLRGYIDKRSGKKSVQVYAALKHTEGTWLHPYQANYGRPLLTSPVVRIASDVDCSGMDVFGSCTYAEHVGFTIEDSELRRIRDVIKTDPSNAVWIFRLKTRAGLDITEGFTKNEFAALLDAMTEYTPIRTQ